MIRDHLLGMLFVLGVLAALRSAEPEGWQRYTFREPHMGTEVVLTFYAPNAAVAKEAAQAAFARIAELDHSMSDYKQTSELMRLCQKAGKGPVPVSADLFKVLSYAQEVAGQTDGAFDVTVGPVVRLWRKARRTRLLPDADALKEALARVGYRKLKLDAGKKTVALEVEGMLLDLGGIAKGYAADALLAVLRRHGITRALVAIGGDITVGEAPPDAKGWKVALAPLKNPAAAAEHYLLLTNAAVSTAGDVEQYALIDGQRYSHIVDPKTGLGLRGRSSVSVIARTGLVSDAWDTALCVYGAEKGLPLLEAIPDAAVLFVRENATGALETFRSKRLAQYRWPAKD